jgi:lipopolysaccharide transport system ATP-binding protein
LRHVELTVHRGETVGVVGRNGSGKSTLLQIIAGTVTPTEGQLGVRGRVAALLELGAGFDPSFTGRENVYLYGALMGLGAGAVASRFDGIVAFSGLGDHIDQPVKTYSSGMYVRLAFAVAINVDPDILIIDEALAVGDEAFQRKCFARIREFQGRGGTLLFVSHDAGAVVELCDRALMLDAGEVIVAGRPRWVVDQYHRLMFAPEGETAAVLETLRAERDPGEASAPSAAQAVLDVNLPVPHTLRYETQGARIGGSQIRTPGGVPVNVLIPGRPYVFHFSVGFQEDSQRVRFGCLIKTTSGFELGGAVAVPPADARANVVAGTRAEVRFQFVCRLNPGTYFLNAGVLGQRDGAEVFLARHVDAALFRVRPDSQRPATGVVDFDMEPEVVLRAETAHRRATEGDPGSEVPRARIQ